MAWRTIRQRTAVWRTLQKAQKKGGLALRNRAAGLKVNAMLKRVKLV